MKSLIKLLLIISAVFATTFIIIKLSGVLTLEQIEGWLTQAKNISPTHLGTIIAVILFADLFVAIPTLTVTILSGYFLGPVYGAIAALTGTMLAGISGYTISRYYRNGIISFLIKDEKKRNEAISAFDQSGFIMIILSRAVPILPEATACLAGITNMNFWKFLLAWCISTIPYTLIATYAGSISTLNDPKPAILAAISISSVLWISWYLFHRLRNKTIGKTKL